MCQVAVLGFLFLKDKRQHDIENYDTGKSWNASNKKENHWAGEQNVLTITLFQAESVNLEREDAQVAHHQ